MGTDTLVFASWLFVLFWDIFLFAFLRFFILEIFLLFVFLHFWGFFLNHVLRGSMLSQLGAGWPNACPTRISASTGQFFLSYVGRPLGWGGGCWWVGFQKK